jgi:hypothetical protein
MSPHQPDIVIRCNHGLRDGPTDFVQRYRWIAEQGVWVPTDNTNEAITYRRRSDNGRLASVEDVGSSREHQAIRCKFCKNKLPVAGRNRLQFALRQLADAGLTSPTIEMLRRVYNRVPKQLG